MPRDRHFFKMSGSGNDFVFVPKLESGSDFLEGVDAVRAVCDRRQGVGADGVVYLLPSDSAAFRMLYLNSDGSRASFCGNAALCSTRLATEIGKADPAGFSFESDAGLIRAHIHSDGQPEIVLPPVTQYSVDFALELMEGEVRAGFAQAGVPHLVVLCDNAERVDLAGRGSFLRHTPTLVEGANVDFISPGIAPMNWRMRTYERGVEGETLACGSGAVASAIMASNWAAGIEPEAPITIQTSSGLPLLVTLRDGPKGLLPSLRGEGRIVFEGDLR